MAALVSQRQSYMYQATSNIAMDGTLGALELLRPEIVTPLPVEKNEKAGKTLRLLCLITGYPPLKISWYLNGELLKESNSKEKSGSTVIFENNHRELIIKNLTPKDSGLITFIAENKYGSVKSFCQLSVEEKKFMKYNQASSPVCKRFCNAFRNVTSK